MLKVYEGLTSHTAMRLAKSRPSASIDTRGLGRISGLEYFYRSEVEISRVTLLTWDDDRHKLMKFLSCYLAMILYEAAAAFVSFYY